MITGYDLAEYLFSNYEDDEERLYSTGDEELDELLEIAFSEGYEYAQREFGEKKDNQSIRKDTGTGAIIGGATGAGIGAYYAGKYTKGIPWRVNKEEAELAKKAAKAGIESIGGERFIPKNKIVRKIGNVMIRNPKTSALGAAGLTAGVIGAGLGSGAGATVGTGRKIVRKIKDREED